MRITFGHSKNKDQKPFEVVWDAERAINAIMVMAGASGVGKTYRLRKMIDEIATGGRDVRFHVIDIHGDIQVNGSSSVKFSESTGYGLNPLKVSADGDFGGVRKRCRGFISMLNQTSRKLGPRQESALMLILEEMYDQGGFRADDPRSWSLDFDPRPPKPGRRKRQPTVADLLFFADLRLKRTLVGANLPATVKFEQLSKVYKKLESTHNKVLAGDPNLEIGPLKEEAKRLYCEWIDAIENWRDIDEVLKFSNREIVKSVQERIKLIDSSGIFKNKQPDFDPRAPVWRYDIASLNTDEQIMFVNTLVEDLFMEAKQSGEKKVPTRFIVLDEAQKFVSEDPDHIINVVCREARKFGLGIIMASQSLTHFPDDVIANAGAKIILGLDESFHDSAARKLKVEAKRFQYIVPQKTALVQIKTKGSLSNRFNETTLS